MRLLLGEGAYVREMADDGDTALHWAVRRGDPGMADLLLDAGANIHARTEQGYSPLDLAAVRGDADLVRRLLARGTVTRVGHDSSAALIWSVKWGDTAMAQLLLDHGADRNFTDRYGNTPLNWANAEQDVGMSALLRADCQR